MSHRSSRSSRASASSNSPSVTPSSNSSASGSSGGSPNNNNPQRAPIVLNEYEVAVDALLNAWSADDRRLRERAKESIRAERKAKAESNKNAAWLLLFQPFFTEFLDIEATYSLELLKKPKDALKLSPAEKVPLINRATSLIANVKWNFEPRGQEYERLISGPVGPPTAYFHDFTSWFKWQVSALKSDIQADKLTSPLEPGKPGPGGGGPDGKDDKKGRRKRGRRKRKGKGDGGGGGGGVQGGVGSSEVPNVETPTNVETAAPFVLSRPSSLTSGRSSIGSSPTGSHSQASKASKSSSPSTVSSNVIPVDNSMFTPSSSGSGFGSAAQGGSYSTPPRNYHDDSDFDN